MDGLFRIDDWDEKHYVGYGEEDIGWDRDMPMAEDFDEQCTCSNGCMDCLGMSWRDFL